MNTLRVLAALAICAIPSFATWSRVLQQTKYCGDSASTCTITVPAPTTGNLLAISAQYNGNGISLASATGIGTWVHPAACRGVITGVIAVDWLYNLSATSGTSITINWSGTAGFIDVFYYEYSGTGPFSFDGCGVYNQSGGASTSVPAGALTTTGANDLAIATVKGDVVFNATTAVTPTPWATPASVINGNEASTHAINFGPTTTQAIFTAPSASNAAGATIAFSEYTSSRKRVISLRGPTEGAAAAAPSGVDFIAQAVADQFSAGTTAAINEGHPHGIPTNWGFYTGSFIADGNNPCASVTPCNPQMGYVIWGVVYADAAGNPATNTRVQIKGCTTYWYDTVAHTWTGSGPYDHPDDEDYQENYDTGPFTSNQRTELDGSLSIKLTPGDVNHFFTPYSRVPFTMANWGGVVNVCQMRLVVDDAGRPDDRASAKILGGVGGDFYPAITGSGIPHNPGIGGGKLKYITTSWRSFAMSTLSYSAIMALPAQPPLNLTGLNP